jgi:hypothetical protein
MPEPNKYIKSELQLRNLPLRLVDVLDSYMPRSPVAYSRITRTPIVQGKISPDINATYSPLLKRITANQPLDQLPQSVIRHESIHAVNDGLDPETLYTNAAQEVGIPPNWWGKDSSFATLHPSRAYGNEALAYLGEDPSYNPIFDQFFLPSQNRDSLMKAYINGVARLDLNKATQLQRLIKPINPIR